VLEVVAVDFEIAAECMQLTHFEPLYPTVAIWREKSAIKISTPFALNIYRVIHFVLETASHEKIDDPMFGLYHVQRMIPWYRYIINLTVKP
jgi:hypothetical protein